jgi:hypothetical protein
MGAVFPDEIPISVFRSAHAHAVYDGVHHRAYVFLVVNQLENRIQGIVNSFGNEFSQIIKLVIRQLCHA